MIPIATHRHGAALFWIVAIACFLAACALVAARVSIRAADAFSGNLHGALTVRIVQPDTQEAVTAAADALRNSPGIFSARAVTPERAASLLRKWVGPGVRAADLPSLRLIELGVAKSQATPAFARNLQHALEGAGYRAEVYGPGQWAETAAATALRARDAAVALVLALGLTALLTAGLAGRARAAADRAAIAPVVDLGATRGQIAAPFAVRSATEGFLAGSLGTVLALGAAALLLANQLQSLPLSDWSELFVAQDAAPLIAIPLLAGLLSAAGARAAASRAFSRAARRA